MISAAKLEANRRNAQLSTGPRSPEGKAAASQNPIVHGHRARHVCMVNENIAEFKKLCQELHDEWLPLTPSECHLVEDMASARWRLGRGEALLSHTNLHSRFMGQALTHYSEYRTDRGTVRFPGIDAKKERPIESIIGGYERRQAAAERSYHRAMKALIQLQKLRGKDHQLQDQSLLDVPNVVPPPAKPKVAAAGASAVAPLSPIDPSRPHHSGLPDAV